MNKANRRWLKKLPAAFYACCARIGLQAFFNNKRAEHSADRLLKLLAQYKEQKR